MTKDGIFILLKLKNLVLITWFESFILLVLPLIWKLIGRRMLLIGVVVETCPRGLYTTHGSGRLRGFVQVVGNCLWTWSSFKLPYQQDNKANSCFGIWHIYIWHTNYYCWLHSMSSLRHFIMVEVESRKVLSLLKTSFWIYLWLEHDTTIARVSWSDCTSR